MKNNDDAVHALMDMKQFLGGTLEALNLMLEQQEKVINEQKNNLDELLKTAIVMEQHNKDASIQSKKDELSPEEIEKIKGIANA